MNVCWVVMCSKWRKYVFKGWLIVSLYCGWYDKALVSNILLLADTSPSALDESVKAIAREKSIGVKIVQCEREFEEHGFMTRFLLAVRYAPDDYLCFMDDDMMIFPRLYRKLMSRFFQNTNEIWGLFGRMFQRDKKNFRLVYSKNTSSCTHCDIVLTKCLFIKKDHLQKVISTYCKDIDVFRTMQSSRPKGNGEDILMSWCHPQRCRCLTFRDRIGNYIDIGTVSTVFRNDHDAHRTRVLQALEKLAPPSSGAWRS